MPEPNLTERQQKYFSALRASLQRDTGKSLAAWVAIAKRCPEEGHRARLRWLKDNYGLLQNHGSHVLSEAFGGGMAWAEPEKLIEALWSDPASRAIFEAIDPLARKPGAAIRSVRMSFTAWSREVQFAAARPVRGGKLMLGVAVMPDASPRLEPPRNESWSDRLKARTLLSSLVEVDAEIEALLRSGWNGAG